MKSQERHELQTNVLADWIGDKIELLKPYGLGILVGVVALAALGLSYVFFFSGEDTSSAASWQVYFSAYGEPKPSEALKDAAKKEKGTPAGNWATLAYAEGEVQGLVFQQIQDPKAAKEAVKDAEPALKEVVESAQDDLLKIRAQFSLAKLYESVGRIEESRKLYEEVAKAEKDSTIGKAAAKGVKRLSAGSQVPDLIAWLAKQDAPTKPAAPSNPFDFGPPEALPERPNLSIPSEMKFGEEGSPFGPSNKDPLFPAESPLGPKPGDNPPAETPADEPKTTEEEKPAVEKPVETTPAEEKPAEEKPAEEKPAEAAKQE